ncbi:MBL fold metallo-hydrolase [bacterium]|nr:MBL fold metallo-hydrolase [bacterium]
MIIKHWQAGILGANNYLIINDSRNEALMIDCSEYTEQLDNELKKHNAELKYVLLTHGHFDHVMGVDRVKKAYPKAKVLAHTADKNLIESIKEFMQKYGMFEEVEVPKIDEYIQEGSILNGQVRIIHTSGHTKGSVCYLIDDNLFSGDTIFLESVGRTDLEGGSFEEIKSNIENKIFTLDENIKIFPGHGNFTTVKHEKENNKFL